MSNYCKYCGQLVNDIVIKRDKEGNVIKISCRGCSNVKVTE